MTRFLAVDDVNRLHDLTINRQGGSPGIRDSAMLDAAVSMPMQSFGGQYLHEGIAAMAAAYLFHICQAHAYVDGNKRTAVLSALAFLTVNDAGPLPSPVELERVTMAVARGELSKGELVQWFVANLDPDRGTN